MAILLERIDSVPVDWALLSNDLNIWLTNLVDSLNTLIELLENNVTAFVSEDGISLPQKTTAEITALALTNPNGTMWYDSDTDEIKAKVGGVVVVVV